MCREFRGEKTPHISKNGWEENGSDEISRIPASPWDGRTIIASQSRRHWRLIRLLPYFGIIHHLPSPPDSYFSSQKILVEAVSITAAMIGRRGTASRCNTVACVASSFLHNPLWKDNTTFFFFPSSVSARPCIKSRKGCWCFPILAVERNHLLCFKDNVFFMFCDTLFQADASYLFTSAARPGCSCFCARFRISRNCFFLYSAPIFDIANEAVLSRPALAAERKTRQRIAPLSCCQFSRSGLLHCTFAVLQNLSFEIFDPFRMKP